MLCCAVLCCAVPYRTVLYRTVPYCSVLYCCNSLGRLQDKRQSPLIALYSRVQHFLVLLYTVVYRSVPYNTILYCFEQYYIPHGTVPYRYRIVPILNSIILHYTIYCNIISYTTSHYTLSYFTQPYYLFIYPAKLHCYCKVLYWILVSFSILFQTVYCIVLNCIVWYAIMYHNIFTVYYTTNALLYYKFTSILLYTICYAMLCYAMLCYSIMWSDTTPNGTIQNDTIPIHTLPIWHHTILCCADLCYATQSCV